MAHKDKEENLPEEENFKGGIIVVDIAPIISVKIDVWINKKEGSTYGKTEATLLPKVDCVEDNLNQEKRREDKDLLGGGNT